MQKTSIASYYLHTHTLSPLYIRRLSDFLSLQCPFPHQEYSYSDHTLVIIQKVPYIIHPSGRWGRGDDGGTVLGVSTAPRSVPCSSLGPLSLSLHCCPVSWGYRCDRATSELRLLRSESGRQLCTHTEAGGQDRGAAGAEGSDRATRELVFRCDGLSPSSAGGDQRGRGGKSAKWGAVGSPWKAGSQIVGVAVAVAGKRWQVQGDERPLRGGLSPPSRQL